jgi:hypothetical protein
VTKAIAAVRWPLAMVPVAVAVAIIGVVFALTAWTASSCTEVSFLDLFPIGSKESPYLNRVVLS